MPPKSATLKSSKAAAGAAKGGKKAADDLDLDQIAALAAQIYGEAQRKMAGKKGAAARDSDMLKEREMFVEQAAAAMREEHLRSLAAAAAPEPEEEPNVPVPLEAQHLAWIDIGGGKWLRFEQFRDEHMPDIVALFSQELSEPYSAFTYEHFLGGWRDLGILAYGIASEAAPAADAVGEMVGCVVSKVSRKAPGLPLRGYVAMLAVKKHFRGHKIGQRLVTITVQVMRSKGCEEVGLETPVTNQRALNLYLELGFVKTKYLTRYYLDGSDAVRLKLWTHDPVTRSA